MNFTQSVEFALANYSVFYGRASRSEFWNFALFLVVVLATCFGFGSLSDNGFAFVLPGIVFACLAIPSAAVLVRRLHDINRSGHWAWLALLPVAGLAVLFALCLKDGDKRQNSFGI
jgi:uncharacterized membrane protein YhaH (DUF805 family)